MADSSGIAAALRIVFMAVTAASAVAAALAGTASAAGYLWLLAPHAGFLLLDRPVRKTGPTPYRYAVLTLGAAAVLGGGAAWLAMQSRPGGDAARIAAITVPAYQFAGLLVVMFLAMPQGVKR